MQSPPGGALRIDSRWTEPRTHPLWHFDRGPAVPDRLYRPNVIRCKDYADAHRQKTKTLDAEEFLRRFVQHVLLKGFVKVRHYGLLVNAQREARLGVCRRLPLVANVVAILPDVDTKPIEPASPRCCPQCGGTRLLYRELTPSEPAAADSSSPAWVSRSRALGQRADGVAALAVRPDPKGRPPVQRLHCSLQRSHRHRAPENPCAGCRLVGSVAERNQQRLGASARATPTRR